MEASLMDIGALGLLHIMRMRPSSRAFACSDFDDKMVGDGDAKVEQA